MLQFFWSRMPAESVASTGTSSSDGLGYKLGKKRQIGDIVESRNIERAEKKQAQEDFDTELAVLNDSLKQNPQFLLAVKATLRSKEKGDSSMARLDKGNRTLGSLATKHCISGLAFVSERDQSIWLATDGFNAHGCVQWCCGFGPKHRITKRMLVSDWHEWFKGMCLYNGNKIQQLAEHVGPLISGVHYGECRFMAQLVLHVLLANLPNQCVFHIFKSSSERSFVLDPSCFAIFGGRIPSFLAAQV